MAGAYVDEFKNMPNPPTPLRGRPHLAVVQRTDSWCAGPAIVGLTQCKDTRYNDYCMARQKTSGGGGPVRVLCRALRDGVI